MSQRSEILKALKSGKTLTPYSALKLCGTLNLRGRIQELEKQGIKVVRRWKKVRKTKVLEYSL